MRRVIADADDEDDTEEGRMSELEEEQGDQSVAESESEGEEAQSNRPSQSQRKRAHLAEDEYLPGSIVRVRLENFVTYDSVEFHPGPRLNMVIGPNGTGKSTIVCAIALGLGWTPNVLGRANDVAAFVKQGKEECFIEIELQAKEQGKRNVIVNRRLKKQDNTSRWLLHGKSATAKDVKSAVDEFQIDIGNLCCFLPQDRVAEFAQMNPIELLAETQKAAGDVQMSRWHELLKEHGKEKLRLTKLISDESDNANHIEDRLNSLQRDVERARERQEIEEMVETLSILVIDARAREKKSLYGQLRDQKQKQEQNVAQIQHHLQPLEGRLKELERDNVKLKNQSKKMSDELQKERLTLQKGRDELETLGNKTQDLVEKHASLNKRDETAKKHINQLNLVIENLRAKVREKPPPPNTSRIDQEMSNLRNSLNSIKQEGNNLNIEYDEIRDDIYRLNKEHESTRAQLHQLDSVKERRLRMLEKADQDTFKAVLWLRNNANLFKGKIYEPVMLEISIRDPRMAHAVEGSVNFLTMKTFVCELQEDYDLFGKMMESQRLRVNFCDRGKTRRLDQFERPATQAELQDYGFDSYIIDSIEGPDIILRYLCDDFHLQKVPVALDDRNVNIPKVGSSGKFQRFIAGRNSHQILRSNYGSNQSQTSTRSLQQARIFNQSIDQDMKRRLDDTLLRIENEKNKNDGRVSSINEQKEVLQARAGKLKEQLQNMEQEKESMLNASKLWEKDRLALSMAETELEKERSRPTLEHQKEQLNRQIDDICEQCAVLLERLCAMVSNQVKKGALLDTFLLQSLHHHEKLQALASLKDSKEQLCNEAKESLRSIVELTEKAKVEFRDLQTELRAKTDLVSASTLQKVRELMVQKESSDELERRLNEENANLAMITSVDPDALETYEARRKELKISQDKIQEYQAKKRTVDQKVEKYEKKWIPALQNLVKDVDQKFSKAFAAVGNAGEVSILKNEDYEKWGIAIKVKFRAEGELQQLDAQRQSGGERSISTITYLLSLTEMSRAPFSVVDEINQGMDQKYERQVHNHMVKVTCENANAGQYFLITPKLLPDLSYHERMRVLIIYNGEWLPERFSLQEYANNHSIQTKKRRLNGGKMNDDRSRSISVA